MSYQKISSQNIDQLLESYPNITFHSRLIKPIIQADIAFHLKLRPDKSTFFDDPKKYFPYQYYIGGKQNASYNFKEFFIQHGVSVCCRFFSMLSSMRKRSNYQKLSGMEKMSSD